MWVDVLTHLHVHASEVASNTTTNNATVKANRMAEKYNILINNNDLG